MDSLLANYADDSDDEQQQQPPPSHNPPTNRKPFFSSLPPPKTHSSSSSSSSSLFSSLPPPTSRQSNPSLFSSLPPPPLPPKPKKIIQFTPPINPSLFNDDKDDDEEQQQKEKHRKDYSNPTTFSTSLSSFLPAPKNSLCLAPSSSRKSVNTDFDQEKPLFSSTNQERSDFDENAQQRNDFEGYPVAAADETVSGYGDYESYSVASSAIEQERSDFGQNVQQRSDFEGYPMDDSYVSYGASQERGDFERMMGRKRGRNEIPTEMVEVKQDELMKNRPREDKVKLTGMAFGPAYQVAAPSKSKPTKLHKRKHQIGSLYYDMKSKEMELAERRSKGFLTKAETQAKYGW